MFGLAYFGIRGNSSVYSWWFRSKRHLLCDNLKLFWTFSSQQEWRYFLNLYFLMFTRNTGFKGKLSRFIWFGWQWVVGYLQCKMRDVLWWQRITCYKIITVLVLLHTVLVMLSHLNMVKLRRFRWISVGRPLLVNGLFVVQRHSWSVYNSGRTCCHTRNDTFSTVRPFLFAQTFL